MLSLFFASVSVNYCLVHVFIRSQHWSWLESSSFIRLRTRTGLKDDRSVSEWSCNINTWFKKLFHFFVCLISCLCNNRHFWRLWRLGLHFPTHTLSLSSNCRLTCPHFIHLLCLFVRNHHLFYFCLAFVKVLLFSCDSHAHWRNSWQQWFVCFKSWWPFDSLHSF